MHSIDAQQSEHNHEDLSGERAVEKMRELAERSRTCFFCTTPSKSPATRAAFASRPMSVQRVDERGALLFLAPIDGDLVQDVRTSPQVQLLFQASAHADFLTLEGSADVSQDRGLIHEIWEPICKVWFTGGPDDPRIAVLRVQAERGQYWETKHGRAVALAKMIVGAALGKTFDDSMQGKLTV